MQESKRRPTETESKLDLLEKLDAVQDQNITILVILACLRVTWINRKPAALKEQRSQIRLAILDILVLRL
jgi:hypothetical protein